MVGVGMELERLVAVDWSGDKSEAGQKRKIWAGVWTRDGRVTLENGRSREELVEWLIRLAAETDAADGGEYRLLFQLSGVVSG
jgi:hypothetical protein